MKKSKGTRTKQGTGRTIAPGRSDGVAGDIRVRMTEAGPKLEAKLGSTWYQSDLNPLNTSPNTGVCKVWVHDGRTPNKHNWVDGGGTPPELLNDVLQGGDEMEIQLPDFITQGNVTGITFMINMGGSHYHAWSWDSAPQYSPTRSNSGAIIHPQNRVEISFHIQTHTIAIYNIGYALNLGSKNSKFKLAVYYL